MGKGILPCACCRSLFFTKERRLKTNLTISKGDAIMNTKTENITIADIIAIEKQRYHTLAKDMPFTRSFNDLLSIYNSTANNGDKILKYENNDLTCTHPEKKCACFACGHRFLASEWTRACANDHEIIVMCPECAVDAILIDGDGYELTDALITDMNRVFFGGSEA